MKTSEEEGLLILTVGVGLGLLVGLLWAPRSGRHTRRYLRRGAEDSLSYLTEEAEKVREGVDRLAEGTRRWLDSLKGTVRSAKP